MTIDAVVQEYQTLAIGQLFPSPTNPRKTFNESALNELAESIRSVGLLQPILARPRQSQNGDSAEYEIVAGERRWRAATIAELTEVPVRIRELTDAEVIEAQVTENLIRADVHPLEEMSGICALMRLDPQRYTVQELSAKFGKSQSFIARRLKLADLIPEAAEALRKDELGIGHAEELAVLKPEDQKDALKHAYATQYYEGKTAKGLVPVAALRRYIEKNILLLLSEAPFDTKDETLYPDAGSCVNCPFRTGYNTLLFPDMKDDSCTDKDCYGQKVTCYIDSTGLPKIAGDWAPVPEDSGIAPRNTFTILNTQRPDEVCEFATEAILGTGHERGDKRTVCLSPDCPIHGDDPSDDDTVPVTKADIERRRQIDAVNRQVSEETAKEYRRELRSLIPSTPEDRDLDLLTYMVAFACEEYAEQFLEEWGSAEAPNLSYGDAANMLLDHLAKINHKERMAVLFDMMLVTYCGLDSRDLMQSQAVAKIAELYHINAEDIQNRVRCRVEAENNIERQQEQDAAQIEEDAPAMLEAAIEDAIPAASIPDSNSAQVEPQQPVTSVKKAGRKKQATTKNKKQGKEAPATAPVAFSPTAKGKTPQKATKPAKAAIKKAAKKTTTGKAGKSAGKGSSKAKTSTARA